MPRLVSSVERYNAIEMMMLEDNGGNPIYGQRDIERITGLSRPFIRKLAKEMGHQFPRNGIEVVGKICVCTNCGLFFRRSPSKADRAKLQFCDPYCKESYVRGSNHPNWQGGITTNSFSTYITNQKGFKQWKETALINAGFRCQITGILGESDELDVHHIKPKAKFQELALDPANALVVLKVVHQEIHQLIHRGKDFDEAVAIVKEKYAKRI